MIAELLDKLRALSRVPQRTGFDVDLQRRFAALLPNLSPSELQSLQRSFLSRLNPTSLQLVPGDLLTIIQELVAPLSPRVVCDPWAGIGAVAAAVTETFSGAKVYAITRSQSEITTGKIIAPQAQWTVDDPVDFLKSMREPIDLAVSNLSFGVAEIRSGDFSDRKGRIERIRADLTGIILLSALERLSPDGCAVFVVQTSFFWSAKSVRPKLPDLGYSLSAVFALPAAIFAPYTQLSAYLIVITRAAASEVFIGQLSREKQANTRLFENFRRGADTGTFELGRLVSAAAFTTFEQLRLRDAMDAAAKSFGTQPRSLGDLALQIHPRYSRKTSDFGVVDNAVFIPLIGNSAVVTSEVDRTLKPHNYAQVVVNPAISDARFVAHFLNSELGRQFRELKKTGTTIPQLTGDALRSLPVFIPDLSTQQAMLAIQSQITAEGSALLGLQNELSSMERDLWRTVAGIEPVEARLKKFSQRLSANTRQEVAQRLEEWFETLPFPLASILRAWQATESEDYRTKYEHLIHFFEATAEFIGVVFLSAFTSNEAVYETHKPTITETLTKMHLSFERATFGTWRLVVDYLAKQTRQLISGDADNRSLCADLFSDPSLALPTILSRTALLPVLSATNKMRNDWTGHGGVVSQEEARLRNELLKGEVQRLREALVDLWSDVQLIRALHCKPRTNGFETEVAVLTSSNSEFLKESRLMSSFLFVDQLYLAAKNSTRALKLIPLVALWHGPESAKNACYFFNRLERSSARFVSYHFLDQPELSGEYDDISRMIRSLTTQADVAAQSARPD